MNATHAVNALELLAMAGGISAASDLDLLLKKVGAAAERLSDSEASSIMLLSRDGKSLYFKVASGEKAQAIQMMTLPLGRGIGGWVAQNLKPTVVNDARQDARFAPEFDQASGFVTRSALCVPMVQRDQLVGVMEVLNKRGGPYTDEDVSALATLAGFASAAIVNARALSEHKNFFSHILEVLAVAVEGTMPGMSGHSARSAKLTRSIARALAVPEYESRMLYYAGLLHDVGYLGFTNPEFLAEMGITKVSEELHPVLSAKLLEGIVMLEDALPVVRHHHERYDGTGFPDGLAGEKIPLGARILYLIESMEEIRMTGLRGPELYKKAAQEARDGAGKSFDPKVVKAFIDIQESRSTAW